MIYPSHPYTHCHQVHKSYFYLYYNFCLQQYPFALSPIPRDTLQLHKVSYIWQFSSEFSLKQWESNWVTRTVTTYRVGIQLLALREWEIMMKNKIAIKNIIQFGNVQRGKKKLLTFFLQNFILESEVWKTMRTLGHYKSFPGRKRVSLEDCPRHTICSPFPNHY